MENEDEDEERRGRTGFAHDEVVGGPAGGRSALKRCARHRIRARAAPPASALVGAALHRFEERRVARVARARMLDHQALVLAAVRIYRYCTTGVTREDRKQSR